MTDKWGFAVTRITDERTDELGPDGYYLRRPVDPPRWHVWLPHSCGEWMIVGWHDNRVGSPKDVAVAELEGFIAEAQEALAALKAGQEYGDPNR
jgi:hypothetical protein